jgi:hypothetical protein
MKTRITKDNALVIIECAIRQQTLINAVETIADCFIDEFNGAFGVLEPLFNIDFKSMGDEEYGKYHEAFFNQVNRKGKDYTKKANKVYGKVLKIKRRYRTHI